jgi:hypothetical protein
MIERKAWHQPKFTLLDARETAQQNPDGPGTDIDAFLADPQSNGDLPETSETANAFGTPHAQADAHS